MPETGQWIGAFIRWITKGCRTALRDEVEGNLEPKWGGTYSEENLIIGIFTVTVLISLVVWIFF